MKVVIPAAGLGTRFLPATKSQPKEMLPLVDKPCIQYLVEEAVNSGIKDIIIITADGKRSIKDHFKFSSKLYKHLKRNQKTQALKEMERIEKLANFTYVKQMRPLGDGHAILCAKHLLKDEPFAVLFGDDIYDSETPALKQLLTKYKKHGTPIVGLHKIPKKDCEKYGMAELDGTLKVKSLVEKPNPENCKSNLALTGKYVVTPELMKELEKTQKTNRNKELRLIDGMKNFIKTSPIHGHQIEGERFDTGDKLGYIKAIVHFALKHEDLGKEFKKHLRNLDF